MLNVRKSDSGNAKIERSIVSARDGSYTALGKLLDHYRDYLLRVANDELESELVPKVAASDLVQETFLQAAKRFPAFQGSTEPELRAWLRQILVNKLKDTNRHYYQSQKRAISREIPLNAAGKHAGLADELECPGSPPSERLLGLEVSARVQTAVDKLPELYGRVIRMRHFERQSLQEIGQKLDRSPEAVRKLWCRAVEKLICELAEHRPSVK